MNVQASKYLYCVMVELCPWNLKEKSVLGFFVTLWHYIKHWGTPGTLRTLRFFTMSKKHDTKTLKWKATVYVKMLLVEMYNALTFYDTHDVNGEKKK